MATEAGMISGLKNEVIQASKEVKRLREELRRLESRLVRLVTGFTNDDSKVPYSDIEPFMTALHRHDWDLARSLVTTSLSSYDRRRSLRLALYRTLDLIWFLTTEDEMQAVFDLISLIISHVIANARIRGEAAAADALAGVVFRSSEFVYLLLVCWSSQADPTAFTKSWRTSKPKSIARLQTVLERRCQQFAKNYFDGRVVNNQTYNSPTVLHRQMQLNVFERFLNLACTQTHKKWFNIALAQACEILVALSNTELAPLPISATGIPKFLDMLVRAGDSQCIPDPFHLAVFSGCKELVGVLLQIADLNGLHQDLDVNTAFYYAAFRYDIAMLECLVEEVDQTGIHRPCVLAAFKGCLHVVAWFVERGIVGDRHLYRALIVATCNRQELVATYLLRHVPRHVLHAHRTALLKEVGKYNVHGVKFLLQSDFLGNPTDTYAVAESIASSDGADVTHDLKVYLQEHWSENAFSDGYLQEQDHYVNVMRILKLGGSLSATKLQDLPPPLWIAITYLPLYKECVENGNGCLLSQRIRGKLFEATKRIGCKLGKEPLAQLEDYLPQFFAAKKVRE